MSKRESEKKEKEGERSAFVDALRDLAETGWSLRGVMDARRRGTGEKRPARRRTFEAADMVSAKERGRRERRDREEAELRAMEQVAEHARYIARHARGMGAGVPEGIESWLSCRNWTVTGEQCEADGCCSFEDCRVENARVRAGVERARRAARGAAIEAAVRDASRDGEGREASR